TAARERAVDTSTAGHSERRSRRFSDRNFCQWPHSEGNSESTTRRRTKGSALERFHRPQERLGIGALEHLPISARPPSAIGSSPVGKLGHSASFRRRNPSVASLPLQSREPKRPFRSECRMDKAR